MSKCISLLFPKYGILRLLPDLFFPFLSCSFSCSFKLLWLTRETLTARQLCSVSSGSHPTPPDHPVAPSQCLACGEETSWRWWLLGEQGWGGGRKREGEAWELYFVMWFLLLCFLIVRLFAFPVPFLSLHQSARQAFVLQFKGASVQSFMLL